VRKRQVAPADPSHPSMKAALEAWGASSNLFHQGFAKEADDDDVIAATMEKPGIVLRRPLGSDEQFSEHAGLPTIESLGVAPHKIKKTPEKKKQASTQAKTGEKQAGKALAFEQERERRERQRRKEDAAAAKVRARRQAAMSKAEAALEQDRHKHETVMAEIKADRAALDKRADAEEARWNNKLKGLEEDLRKASR
jgi:colicin import membrane protein